MRRRITLLLFAVLLTDSTGIAADRGLSSSPVSQQVSQAERINRLKDSIKRFEEADKDPNTLADVKELNRRYLQQARSELETLLNNSISGWRAYLKNVGDNLKEEQKKEVEGVISALEQDLKELKSGSSDQVATTSQTDIDKPPEKPPSRQDTPPAPVTQQPAAPLPPLLTPTATRLVVKDCGKINADPNAYSLYERYVCQMAKDIKEDKTGKLDQFTNERLDPIPDAGLGASHYFNIALAMIGVRDKPTYLVEAEEARTDKQVGAGPQSTGSTSLVVKGGVPTILGLAVENGALTQTISDTTITFRGNPVGIFQALANRGYIQSYDETRNNAFLRILKNLSFSLSFDTSRGNDQTNTSPGSMPPSMPNVFTGDRQQLSQVTARYEFYNERDPRHRKYRKDWEEFLKNPAIALTIAASEIFRGLQADPVFDRWYQQADAALKSASANDVETVVKAQFALLPVNNLAPETVEKLVSLEKSFAGYLTARKNLLDRIQKGAIVAFEYTNTRNVNSPNLSNFRLIAEKGPGGNFDATFNGSLTIFDKIPTGMSRRVRDFQFAGQIDYRAGNLLSAGDVVFFASGRYERLLENAMDPMGMVVMDTKGDIAVGQVGIKIPVKGTGFRIPISFSFANRTELIKEKEIRGNIGFTFDLDALFANIKP